MRGLVSIGVAMLLAAPAFAANLQSHCIALANSHPDLHYASLGEGLEFDEARISYIGHSTYLIETPSGLSMATDFTGYAGPDVIPDVVTMNHAHSSHWTANPDPRIPHVLKGWGDGVNAAEHRLELGDEVLIRNVPTDIRSFDGREPNGNSIFIFELAGLCIGHLGHLHHEPSESQYAAMGRLDVVMAPVDGGMTLPLPDMIKVLKRVRAQVVLPMHWFGGYTLEAFLVGMSDEFEIENNGESSTVVSLRELPRKPTIRVLMPTSFVGSPSNLP
jgi:L-ascorbate metabolism protein UlaG (beta-lactamase superfamily)